MREYRLLNFVKHFYYGQMPSEQQVSGLFQITAIESRALIRSVSSKYQYELESIIQQTLRNKLEQDARVNANVDYHIALDSNFYREEYNKILATRPKFALLEKDNQTNGIYIIRNAEYQYLCQHFNIQPNGNSLSTLSGVST